jgi:adenylosuccinate synthase
VPSGILHPGKVNVIGNGVAVDPLKLLEEVEGLRARGRRGRRPGLQLSAART